MKIKIKLFIVYGLFLQIKIFNSDNEKFNTEYFKGKITYPPLTSIKKNGDKNLKDEPLENESYCCFSLFLKRKNNIELEKNKLSSFSEKNLHTKKNPGVQFFMSKTPIMYEYFERRKENYNSTHPIFPTIPSASMQQTSYTNMTIGSLPKNLNSGYLNKTSDNLKKEDRLSVSLKDKKDNTNDFIKTRASTFGSKE